MIAETVSDIGIDGESCSDLQWSKKRIKVSAIYSNSQLIQMPIFKQKEQRNG